MLPWGVRVTKTPEYKQAIFSKMQHMRPHTAQCGNEKLCADILGPQGMRSFFKFPIPTCFDRCQFNKDRLRVFMQKFNVEFKRYLVARPQTSAY